MSRLIDTDRLLKELGQIWNIPDDWDGYIDETCEKAFDVIENQPTAYDLDNVVQELKDMKLVRVEQCHEDYEIEIMTENNFDDAIEIVKRGGVDE